MAHEYDIGLMTQPGNGYARQIPRWPYWAADNGCFSQGARFDLGRYLRWLDGLPRERCLFAVAPDVFGDADATARTGLPVLPTLRDMGFPAAYVAQPGIRADALPWEAFDVLFIGGDDPFKALAATWALVREAKARGVHVHQGRVNTARRFEASRIAGCDSADGTFLGFGPDVNLPRLLGWLNAARAQPAMELSRRRVCEPLFEAAVEIQRSPDAIRDVQAEMRL